MKPRSDSLYATLSRLDLLNSFFELIADGAPSYDDMVAWLKDRGVRTSRGAIYTLITYHMGGWRTRQAIKAAEAEALTLPEGTTDIIRERMLGLRLDLSMRELSTAETIALLKLEQADRAAENQAAALKLAREKWEAAEKRLDAVKAALTAAKAAPGGGLTPETLTQIEDAIGML